jgi:altronate hydrolase
MTITPILRAHVADSVATALRPLSAGEPLGGGLAAAVDIAAGHKVALHSVAAGQPVIKLGQMIGLASQAIAPGAHVHAHNLAFTSSAVPAMAGSRLVQPAPRSASFMGIVRHDGRVATRNFIAVLTSVNCSATVARRIAGHFTPDRLADYPAVDGVAAFTHSSGCGMAKAGQGIDNLRRTIAGYARHPNFAGVLIVGLGCEVNQIADLVAVEGLETGGAALALLDIQQAGGTRAAIDAGIAAVTAMLPAANRAMRQPVSAAHLTVGLQCGASDGYSALTANPALGRAADLVVAAGGRIILSETPEIFGAENLLIERARDPAVADALRARLAWWQEYAASSGADLDNNPSPGNLAGGITTILEKSLGAVAKSGTSPLNAVIDYAAPVTAPGFSFMDTPGYDPCSATGQIAGGANLIVFTTGRGSVFGSVPAPTLKLASNSALAARMADDIDIDCGRLISGEATLDALGEEIFAAMLALASGRPSKSEALGFGDSEFVPWVPGAAM